MDASKPASTVDKSKPLTVSSVMTSWLDVHSTLDESAIKPLKQRPSSVVQTIMLQCQLKLHTLIVEKDSVANLPIYEMKNKQLMMRKNVKGKAVTRMSLHGPLSLVETPMSYPFCTIGNLTLYVDGSQAVSGSVDTVICPCLAWSLPKSADDAETTMVLDDETFTVDISRGPIKQSFECTAKVLRMKDTCAGDALVRPLLPSEVAKSKKRKATP